MLLKKGYNEIPNRYHSTSFIIHLCFFQKMEIKRQRCTARQYADVCIFVLCTLLHPHACHNISTVHSEPSVQTYEYGSVCRCFNRTRGFRAADFVECYYDATVWFFVPYDA